MSWQNGRPLGRRLLGGLITAVGVMLFIPVVAAGSPVPARASSSESRGHYRVERPDAALTAHWWQRFVATAESNSLERCDVGPKHIVFLAGTTGDESADTRTCTTHKAKSFLVPLINVECSTAENNGTTFPELRVCADGFARDFIDLKLIVDGHPIRNLTCLRVRAESTFTSVDGNAFGIPPFSKSKFASDGYWALIKLTPGKHTLSFGGSYPPGRFTTLVTYNLVVKK